MKLKYERFDGVSCLYIRGSISADQMRLLSVGLESVVNELNQSLVINASNSQMDASVAATMLAVKKKLSTNQNKIYWVNKDRTVGDFPTIDLFLSRLSGFKFRQIGDRIKLDDETFALMERIRELENREKDLVSSGHNTRLLVLENHILKEQKRIIEECVSWQTLRQDAQKPEPNTLEAMQKAQEISAELKTVFGYEVDL